MIEIKNNIIALMGMTGCGKSSVGKILARKTGAVLIDLDEEIVARYGEIPAIFTVYGESGFRKIEKSTLEAVLERPHSGLVILSLGGGAPTYEPSRELIAQNTTVVWLKRSVDSIAADKNILMRPPVNGDINNYKRLLEMRYPIYQSVADYAFYNAFPQRTAAAIIKKFKLSYKKAPNGGTK